MSTPASRGFLRDFFDLSFTHFITARVIKVLFVLTLIVLFVAYVGIAIAIFNGGSNHVTIQNGQLVEEDSGGNTAFGIAWLVILGPLVMFLYALLYRVVFELLVVIFRIYGNTTEQVALLRAMAPGAVSPREPPELGGSSSAA